MENSVIEMLQFPININYTVTAGGDVSTYNNISWTLNIKSVDAAGTITTRKTATSTFTNKSHNT